MAVSSKRQSGTEPGGIFPHEVFRNRQLAVEMRAGLVERILQTLADRLDDAPPAVAQTGQGVRVAEAIAQASAVASAFRAMEPGRFDLAGVTALQTALTGLRAAIGKVQSVWYPFAARARRINPRFEGNDFPLPMQTLDAAAIAFSLDALWLTHMSDRFQIEAGATAAALRAKRMRAHRKAGFRIVPVRVHETDETTFRRLGLLRPTGKATPDEIAEAANLFYALAITAVSADEDAGPKATSFGLALLDTLRMAPALRFQDRLRAIADAAARITETPED